MIIIDKETTDFVKLINLMLPEHGDIASVSYTHLDVYKRQL